MALATFFFFEGLILIWIEPIAGIILLVLSVVIWKKMRAYIAQSAQDAKQEMKEEAEDLKQALKEKKYIKAASKML